MSKRDKFHDETGEWWGGAGARALHGMVRNGRGPGRRRLGLTLSVGKPVQDFNHLSETD